MLALSESTYNNTSIAALGVAAHEVGHACQDEENYFPLKLRSILVPIVNLGSRIAIPIVILGIIIEFLAGVSGGIGGYLISIGIICYSLSTIFCLITLPVEINASRRALKMLESSGALTSEELKGAKKVLSAAALTYVASLFVSLLYLLRFLLIVSRFRRRD
jgi:Zn-dependent membrane protease YugP